MTTAPIPMPARACLASRFIGAELLADLARRLGVLALTVVLLAASMIEAAVAAPSAEASCTASALNRNAPLQSDYSFTLYNLPGAAAAIGPNAPQIPAPPFRVRVTCSDGTVGETELAYPAFGSTAVYTGEIVWRPATPVPVALGITAGQARLNGGESTQLSALGVLRDGRQVDLTGKTRGTLFTSSNPLIATVDDGGRVLVTAQFATGSAARVVMAGQNDGVQGSTVLQLGPRGRLAGRVLQANGVSPVSGAEVSVTRNQPRETLATVRTDSNGDYLIPDVSAGSFTVSVVDPQTGDHGQAYGTLQSQGEDARIDVRMNGQGTVTVTVLDGSGSAVGNVPVTLTSLGATRDIRTVRTNTSGVVVFERVPTGFLSASTTDPSSGLIGTANGQVAAGGGLPLTLRLQPVASIAGAVLASDAVTPQAGVQVRLVSAARGIVTQVVTAEGGAFRFDSLPLSDGPYALDAMLDGRLRGRETGIVLNQGGQVISRNVVFGPTGTVRGSITRAGGATVADAQVTVQSLVGSRLSYVARSDANGNYVIDGVPVGAFGITAVGGQGETANAGGNMPSDGAIVALNLQLASSGIVGTVFGRDGRTPVGAGVTVTLSPGNRSTTTDAQGQFGLPISAAGSYSIEASDGSGNRGRTSVVLTTVVAGAPVIANVVFLGQGSVEGVVRDPAGVPQANVPVQITSAGLFGGSTTVQTDAGGRYRASPQFVGDFTVYARNPSTELAGFASGRLSGDGETASANVTLAATGRIDGSVVRADNVTPAAGAVVQLQLNGRTAITVDADASGAFDIPAVPLGDFTLLAILPADGDKGQAVSRISALNEVRTVRIRLLGLGNVNVLAQDNAGAPVAGASVTLNSASAFGGSQTGVTDGEGRVSFGRVFNGDFEVIASRGSGVERISGSAQGTLTNGRDADVVVSLSRKETGSVSGVVTQGLSAAPQSAVEVRLTRVSGSSENRVFTTGLDGRFTFEQLEVGIDYRLTARVNGRVRARADVRVSADGEAVIRDLALLGVGTVSGRTLNAQGAAPVGNIRVTLSNPDPTYGGSWDAYSQADGSYRFTDVPAGSFTLRARSGDGRLQAQDSGTVRFDQDAVQIDLNMVDSAVNLPINRYDANGFLFDLRGDGSIARGENAVFDGDGSAARRGALLDLVVGGVGVPFLNGDGSVGRLTQDGQLLEVDELHSASGLNVSRRVYVPKQGYFARYIEVLENRTAAPITVGVRVSTHIAAGRVGARVVDSSSNDAVFTVGSGAGADRWVVADDNTDSDPFTDGGNPSVAWVFDGEGGESAAGAGGTTALNTVARLSVEWQSVTLQPGASAAFMHFTVQQTGRIPARTSAQRLAALPPEALDGLTAEERAIIRNFRLPADGLSTQEPLPAVEGSTVRGVVYAGDSSTPVANSTLTFKSDSPYYTRTYTTNSANDGSYSLASGNFGSASVRAVPQDRFRLYATHPSTREQSPTVAAGFEAAQPLRIADVAFVNTGLLKGTVRRAGGALVTSGSVTIPYRYPSGSQVTLSASIGSDGGYLFTGLIPGDYLPQATLSHPQGQPVTGSAAGPASVPAAETTVADVTLEPTGEVTGIVRAANGDPAVGVTVQLDPDYICCYAPYRQTTTDTGGRYRFTDVRLGAHALRATSSSGLAASASVSVAADTQSVSDLTLTGIGTLTVQVNFARGVAAPGASVYVLNLRSGTTNGSGSVQFAVPAGQALTVEARHPDNSALTQSASVTLPGDGAVESLTLSLPAAGSVSGTVLRPDGSTRAAGVRVVLRRTDGIVWSRSVTTNNLGDFRFNGVPVASYSVSAEDVATSRYADADILLDADGQDRNLSLVLADNRIPLPSTMWDANNFKYDIDDGGQIGYGWRGSYSLFSGGNAGVPGGAVLFVNGERFLGDGSAFLEAGKRQYAITQVAPLSGLNVSRKVFVPRGAYFARYLDTFENPGGDAVTVEVSLRSGFGDNSMRVVDTSSGDAVIDAGSDAWVVIDDASDADPFISTSEPATAFVLGDRSRGTPDRFSHVASGPNRIDAGWSRITVPAGGRVTLMHFAAPQISRASARIAAERLSALPPEALQSLTDAERASIVNFTLPTDGVSTVAALPSLLGSVSGRVLEGDRRTTVAQGTVQLRSLHPLFGRSWLPVLYNSSDCEFDASSVTTLRADAAGAWSLSGRMQDAGSLPLPVGVEVEARPVVKGCSWGYGTGHPVTGIAAPAVTAVPDAQTGSATLDIVFPSGVLTGTVTGPSDYGVGGGSLRTTVPSGRGSVSVSIANDGSYLLPGMPAGSYLLSANVPHNQGTSLIGSRSDAAVTEGEVTVTDVQIEATGSLTGAVITANGEASVSSAVRVDSIDVSRSIARSTTTDSLGRYNLSALPVGRYRLTVTDSRTGGTTVIEVAIATAQVTSQNVTLTGVGALVLQATYARGVAAASANVYLSSPASNINSRYVGRTDGQGRLSVPTPVGAYSISVRHPSDSLTTRVIDGVLAANNETQNLAATLPPLAAMRVTVVDADAGNAPLQGVAVRVTMSGCNDCYYGVTDGSGRLLISTLRDGAYTVNVRTPQGRSAELRGVLSSLDDGLTLERTFAISAVQDRLGVISFVGERQLFSVPARPGDVISVNINGVQVGEIASSYIVAAQAYAADKSLLAQGYGYDQRNSYLQYNELNNLLAVPAVVEGSYPIVVSNWRSSASYLGGYRLQVRVNGEAVTVGAYVGGGVVRGTLVRADGVTPAVGQPVELRTSDGLAMRVRTLTDSIGQFSFPAVPLAAYELNVLSSDASRVLMTERGTLDEAGQIRSLALRLQAQAQLQVQVEVGASLPVPSSLYLTVSDALGSRTEGPVVFQGGASTSQTFALTTYGDDVSVRAQHPNSSLIAVTRQLQPQDGQTVPLTLQLRGAQVSGGILTAGGLPFQASMWVEVYRAADRAYLTGFSTGGDGRYSGVVLPSGEALVLSVQDPYNAVSSQRTVTLSSEAPNTIDLTLAGRGAVSGVLRSSTGTPIADAWVSAYYVYDDLRGWESSMSSNTDGEGRFRIDNLPVGRPLRLQVEYWLRGALFTTTQTVQLVSDLQEGVQDLTLTLPSGRATVTVSAADGLPIDGLCSFSLLGGEGGGEPSLAAARAVAVPIGGSYAEEVCETGVEFTALPDGIHVVRTQYGDASFTIADQNAVSVHVLASVFRGMTRYADGSPAAGVYIESLMSGSELSYIGTQSDLNGVYRLVGVPAGDWRLGFEDGFGLRGEASGTFPDTASVQTRDLVLPASGTVRGVVRDHRGQPVIGAEVYLRSSGLPFDRYETTDADGRFVAQRVAVGDLTFFARNPDTGLVATGTAVLRAEGQVVDVVLSEPETFSLSGQVQLESGEPVPDVTVSAVGPAVGPFGEFQASALADADGRYQFGMLPLGVIRLQLAEGGYGGQASLERLTSGAATLDLTVSAMVNLGFTFNSPDSSRYDFGCTGVLGDGGYAGAGDAYDSAYALNIAGNSFPCLSVASLRNGGRELLLGPARVGAFEVVRRLYVPSDGRYARYIELITNTGASAQTINVTLSSNLGSDSATRVVVSPTDTAHRYAVTTEGASGGDPALAHVFAGTTSTLVPVATISSDNLATSWTLTIPAGSTAGLMHFAVQRAPGDAEAARVQALSLTGGNDPDMFRGIGSERSSIRNFIIP
ncbi:carboxypeptidase regulatory-like domain-containing protein [Methyloversatilis discipulorum]|uniref:carboxypeptidase regulatory-like domain-containing protein n=1 Tax=Methyloversatilis discipulorum TaxID=1119528 RepID=UPI003F3B7F6D